MLAVSGIAAAETISIQHSESVRYSTDLSVPEVSVSHDIDVTDSTGDLDITVNGQDILDALSQPLQDSPPIPSSFFDDEPEDTASSASSASSEPATASIMGMEDAQVSTQQNEALSEEEWEDLAEEHEEWLEDLEELREESGVDTDVSAFAEMEEVLYLNGPQEVPSVETEGYGISSLSVIGSEMRYEIDVYNLTSPITAAHLHRAPMGENGPPIREITFVGNHAEGTLTLTDEELADFEEGNLYFNVHTQQYPNGEIRGQL
jgi:hypothetical protein